MLSLANNIKHKQKNYYAALLRRTVLAPKHLPHPESDLHDKQVLGETSEPGNGGWRVGWLCRGSICIINELIINSGTQKTFFPSTIKCFLRALLERTQSRPWAANGACHWLPPTYTRICYLQISSSTMKASSGWSILAKWWWWRGERGFKRRVGMNGRICLPWPIIYTFFCSITGRHLENLQVIAARSAHRISLVPLAVSQLL